MAGTLQTGRERTLVFAPTAEGRLMAVFELSVTFFALALAGIVATTRTATSVWLSRTRWISAACIVLGILSLLV
ncbi:hypothetical protein [Halalkalicoccus jeotgali]|uniref:Uncharacterized protein n=1 Tax=Halalkalicoccus jeotgali (strain DSM 18796 / CECT 7217 / JCM 14584 / KCTC 4019 / B3) TaxID=795797 RepID=D8J5T2_HALJB|nr:hypothetical protein [Halalkalicoccus jeotgali]ADJ13738.1 hypothetical protein HacjB3_01725 [Halalkalicoccus jeotgali B3]ELY34216.1 hypothetical protein C497_17592 [Halalkalicoccus jeotgali B3]